MTPCERWKALLADLVSNPGNPELKRLTAAEKDMIWKHNTSCDACADEYDFLQSSSHLEEWEMELIAQAIGDFYVEMNGTERGDVATAQQLWEERERDDESVRQPLRAFIAAHPEMALAAWKLPSDLDLADLYSAGEAVRMTCRAVFRRGEPEGEGLLGEDGSFLPVNDERRSIPAFAMRNEVARCLDGQYDAATIVAMVRWTVQTLRRMPTYFRRMTAEPTMIGLMPAVKLRPNPKGAPEGGI